MRALALGIVVIWSLASPAGTASPNPNGLWRTQMHGAHVEIRTCADRSPCAFLTWVDDSIAQGNTRDVRNPDVSMRNRPLIGLPILWGLRSTASGWEGGSVYNPDTGQTFRSSMRFRPDGKLQVTGCWGPLCRSETWVRVSNREN